MEGNKAEFIKKVMKELKLIKPVLVSPSMSGEYSIQILKNTPQLISGLVAIAPVKITLISKEEYTKIQVTYFFIEKLTYLTNIGNLPIICYNFFLIPI